MPTLLHRILGRVATRHLVAIDIGSSAALRALLFDEERGTYRALDRRTQELPHRVRDLDLIPLIEEHLRRLLIGYVRRIGRVPDAGLIGLGSQFTFNEIGTAFRNRPDPGAPVRPKELEETLDDFLKAHRERTVGSRIYALAHLMPLGVRVDGYPVEELSRHTRGRKIELSVLATYALEEYWRSIWRLRTLFGGIPITTISNQAAVAAALITGFGVKDGLAIKIGARNTEVSMFTDGELLATGQYAVGGESITGALAEALGTTRSDAERVKRQWGSLTIPDRARKRAEEAIGEASTEWLNGLADFLHRGLPTALPEHIYLFGGGARLAAFGRALTTEPWHRSVALHERLAVRRLDAEDITGLVFGNSRPPLTGPEETSLAALAFRLSQTI